MDEADDLVCPARSASSNEVIVYRFYPRYTYSGGSSLVILSDLV